MRLGAGLLLIGACGLVLGAYPAGAQAGPEATERPAIEMAECDFQIWRSVCSVGSEGALGLQVGMDLDAVAAQLPLLRERGSVYFYNDEIGTTLLRLEAQGRVPELEDYFGMMIGYEYRGTEGGLRFVFGEGRIEKIEWEGHHIPIF